ncbi:hypothetical protein D3C85_1462810 [compost metagenome]
MFHSQLSQVFKEITASMLPKQGAKIPRTHVISLSQIGQINRLVKIRIDKGLGLLNHFLDLMSAELGFCIQTSNEKVSNNPAFFLYSNNIRQFFSNLEGFNEGRFVNHTHFIHFSSTSQLNIRIDAFCEIRMS